MFTFIYDYMSENDVIVLAGQSVRVIQVFDNENGVADCLIKWEEKHDDGTVVKMEMLFIIYVLASWKAIEIILWTINEVKKLIRDFKNSDLID